MSRSVVLGGGMVGSVMALDLARDPDREVLLVDSSPLALEAAASQDQRLGVLEADLSRPEVVTRLAAEADLVLGALPSRFGFDALGAVIEAGTPYCDITFMPQDAWDRHEQARTASVVAVVDCGVAPGMSNLLAGLAARRLTPCRSMVIRVGGLPAEPRPPWMYKAAFSPADVLEEYTRPARVVKDGQVVTCEALSGTVEIDFPGVGLLESFTTDGLRSLTETLDVPDMVEQTLRYPGHRDLAWAFRETGLLSTIPVEIDGKMVVPRALTSAVLFPLWTYAPGEVDLTIMRVEAEGDLDGQSVRLTWDLLDRLDPVTGWTSMARTTAFPATIMARLIEQGVVCEPGVYAPERLAGDDRVVETLMAELTARGVTYTERIEPLR